MKTELNYEDLLDVPFVEKGRDPKVGLDCWGYCMELARRVGKNLPEVEQFTEIAEEKKLPQPRPFCLVALRLNSLEYHVGFVLDEMRFTHIREKGGVTTARFSSLFYRQRIIGYYDI